MKIQTGQVDLAPARAKPTKLGGPNGETTEIKKQRLRKATKEFESFFVLYMLRAMRKTIPETGFLDGGLGQDIYTSMFDEELSKQIAGSSPGSLSEMLYKSLEKRLEADIAENPSKVEPQPATATPANQPPIPERPVETPPIAAEPAADAKTPSAATSSRYDYSKPKITADPILSKYGHIINKAARLHGVSPQVIYSVIVAESGGRANAVSPKGAKGLMQLAEGTAEEMGVDDSFDPHDNIIGGAKYLRRLLDRFDGDLTLALAAYNAGPGSVSKYNGVPPFPETQRYVKKVLGQLHSLKKA